MASSGAASSLSLFVAGLSRWGQPRFEGTVWLYNRVGKTGSESLLAVLSRHCTLRQLSGPSADGVEERVWQFDNASARLVVIGAGLEEIRRIQTLHPTRRTCRVLAGHFRWLPVPARMCTRFVSSVREPLARWRSLHNFYHSHGWCTMPPGRCIADYGRSTSRNVSRCILAHEAQAKLNLPVPTAPGYAPSDSTAARACVSARDAMQADYFFQRDTEQATCEVGLIERRYAMVTVLERLRDVPRLLALMLNGTSQRSVPHIQRLPRINRTPPRFSIMWEQEPLVQQVLLRELDCDMRLYDAVIAWNDRTELRGTDSML